MNYEQWRDELFGHARGIDPAVLAHSPEFDAVPPNRAFDFVDRMLVDPDVHMMFSKDQLGNGINTVYRTCCSDWPFLYTAKFDEERRLRGVRNLVYLYRNYFERYCTAPAFRDDNDRADGPMGSICFMLWEVFVLCPGNCTSLLIDAAIDVMQSALESRNDNCLASAIHGLGHWKDDVPDAAVVLKHWLKKPTTQNMAILEYARTAMSGEIL